MNRSLCVAACILTACAVVAAPVPADRPWITGWDKSVDPDMDCKFTRDKDALTIEAPGKDHDIAIERGLMNSPRLLRDVEGDFTAQVRVAGAFQPSNESTSTERIPFVGAGLLLMADENTYVRLERAAIVTGGETKTYANWELRQDGKWVLMGTESALPLEDKATYLRLTREGDNLLASVSHDGKEWKELKTLEVKLPAKVKIGVAAGGTSMDVFTPRFDQFKLTQKGRQKKRGPPETTTCAEAADKAGSAAARGRCSNERRPAPHLAAR